MIEYAKKYIFRPCTYFYKTNEMKVHIYLALSLDAPLASFTGLIGIASLPGYSLKIRGMKF